MKIILPCLCEELWNLGWIVIIYVYSPESITQQDGCVCTSEPGVLWAKYLLSLHPNKFFWKYCSRWLLTLCSPACFSKRILNKALDPSKMCVLDFCHRNQFTEIHGTGHMPLFRLKCTAAAQSQLKGAPNIKSIFNPCKVTLHQPHPDVFVLMCPSLSHPHKSLDQHLINFIDRRNTWVFHSLQILAVP